jgi:multiple sugar transport system permease protein
MPTAPSSRPVALAAGRERRHRTGGLDSWLPTLFLTPGALLTLTCVLLPMVYAIRLSFYKLDSFVGTPEWVGFGNYARLVADSRFWNGLLNGLVYSLATIVLQVALGIAIALLMNEVFRGRALLQGLTMVPYILPTVVVALTWRWMLDGSLGILTLGARRLGLTHTAWFDTPGLAMLSVVVISVWTWTPFVSTAFLAALKTIPPELYEAARVDGSNAWQRFFYVVLPTVRPVLVVIVLLRGIWMFNKFDIIWLMTKGGPLEATEHLPVLSYVLTFNLFDIGGGAAVATISFLLLAGIVSLYLRLFPMDEP